MHRANLHVSSLEDSTEFHGIFGHRIHHGRKDTGDVVGIGSTHKVGIDVLFGPSFAVCVALLCVSVPDVGSGF